MMKFLITTLLFLCVGVAKGQGAGEIKLELAGGVSLKEDAYNNFRAFNARTALFYGLGNHLDFRFQLGYSRLNHPDFNINENTSNLTYGFVLYPSKKIRLKPFVFIGSALALTTEDTYTRFDTSLGFKFALNKQMELGSEIYYQFRDGRYIKDTRLGYYPLLLSLTYLMSK